MSSGIPALLNKLSNVTSTIQLVSSDIALVASFFGGPTWGVFDAQGNVAIEADTVVSVEFKREYKIVDYPLEAGAFASYNKVKTPYFARVQLTRGGSVGDRNAFFAAVTALAASLDTVNVIMPEGTINNANLESYNIRRTVDSGISLITAELTFREIRVTAYTQSDYTAAPDGADLVSVGTLQPQTPSLQSVSSLASNVNINTAQVVGAAQ